MTSVSSPQSQRRQRRLVLPLAAAAVAVLVIMVVAVVLVARRSTEETSVQPFAVGAVYEGVVAKPDELDCAGSAPFPLHVIEAGGRRWFEHKESGRAARPSPLESGKSYQGELRVVSVRDSSTNTYTVGEFVTAGQRMKFGTDRPGC